jgi:hypothetical protein
MNNNLSFHPTIVGSLKSNVDVDSWEKVQEHYQNGDYVESIRHCINYINPNIEKKFANADKTAYNVPHGSVIVNIKITEQELIITAPFLDITNAKRIPVLRQVAQINFSPLTLSHIDLDGNKLYFKFNCPLDLCEPYKVYDVLREICINADNYDDEFIAKFNAAHLQEPKVYHYTQEEKETAWKTIQSYIQEAFDGYEQLENKRLNNYLWDILVITLLKIDYYCSPQGNVRNGIEKAIANLNGKDDYYQRLSGGKEYLKKLQQYDITKFENDLYRIETFVPYKFRTTLETVRNNFKKPFETAENEMKVKDFTGATFTLQYAIFNFLYNNNVDDNIANILTAALQNASAKPMQEASVILFDAIKKIMTTDDLATTTSAPKNNQQENTKAEKKGFFSKLFG